MRWFRIPERSMRPILIGWVHESASWPITGASAVTSMILVWSISSSQSGVRVWSGVVAPSRLNLSSSSSSASSSVSDLQFWNIFSSYSGFSRTPCLVPFATLVVFFPVLSQSRPPSSSLTAPSVAYSDASRKPPKKVEYKDSANTLLYPAKIAECLPSNSSIKPFMIDMRRHSSPLVFFSGWLGNKLKFALVLKLSTRKNNQWWYDDMMFAIFVEIFLSKCIHGHLGSSFVSSSSESVSSLRLDARRLTASITILFWIGCRIWVLSWPALAL